MSASLSSRGPCEHSPSRGSETVHRWTRDSPGPGLRDQARSLLVRCISAITLTVAAAEGSTPETSIERLEGLGRVLQSRPVWGATYTQEYLPAGMTAGETDRGTVWVSWPDRAYFRAGEPVVRTMGVEGRRVRLLDLDVPSCDDHRMDDDEWARIPLAAVLDPQSAVDHFAIVDSGTRGFLLVPRQPGGVARVEIDIGDDGLPASVTIVDPQGATNRLVFEGWAAAGLPPGGQWLPQPPSGIECVAESEQQDGAW
jgi:hypothetical protein